MLRQSRSGRYKFATSFDHGAPIRTLGLAPFAGILLTLTLILVALRPPATHALVVDLPIPWPELDELGPLTPAVNRLIVTETGAILWNSEQVDHEELTSVVDRTFNRFPREALQFDPAPDAPMTTVLPVLGTLHKAGAIDHCFRFMGSERYREYNEPPKSLYREPNWTTRCDPPIF